MQENTGPWYKHFWPWFMLTLLSTVVIASLVTVYIAVKSSDDLVNDNYYKDGLGINMQLDQDRLARDLAASAQLFLSEDALIVDLTIEHDKPSQLIALFSHPADDLLDQKVFLFMQEDGTYRGEMVLPSQRFYVELQGAKDGKFWRLTGEIPIQTSSPITLKSR